MDEGCTVCVTPEMWLLLQAMWPYEAREIKHLFKFWKEYIDYKYFDPG